MLNTKMRKEGVFMKTRICKITALCLVLYLILSAFCACTQEIQIRFVDKDGNDRFSVPAAGTAQTAVPAANEVSSPATESSTADSVLPGSTTAAETVLNDVLGLLKHNHNNNL